MEFCVLCGHKILVATPGCHMTGTCPTHGLAWVIYPPSGECAHAHILENKELRESLVAAIA